MSNSIGEIWTPEGERLGFFEYSGTPDTCCTRIYETRQQAYDNWRKDNQRECHCRNASRPVVIYSSYGFGFHFQGAVCMACCAITKGVNAEGLEWADGHPFLDEQMRLDHGRLLPCPKCGGKIISDGHRSPLKCAGCQWQGYEWNIVPEESK